MTAASVLLLLLLLLLGVVGLAAAAGGADRVSGSAGAVGIVPDVDNSVESEVPGDGGAPPEAADPLRGDWDVLGEAILALASTADVAAALSPLSRRRGSFPAPADPDVPAAGDDGGAWMADDSSAAAGNLGDVLVDPGLVSSNARAASADSRGPPVYRGSSVGSKVLYRGAAAAEKTAADAPTRFTVMTNFEEPTLEPRRDPPQSSAKNLIPSKNY